MLPVHFINTSTLQIIRTSYASVLNTIQHSTLADKYIHFLSSFSTEVKQILRFSNYADKHASCFCHFLTLSATYKKINLHPAVTSPKTQQLFTVSYTEVGAAQVLFRFLNKNSHTTIPVRFFSESGLSEDLHRQKVTLQVRNPPIWYLYLAIKERKKSEYRCFINTENTWFWLFG